jgi:hypothetical protein
MANAEQERQKILTTLSHIFWSNTDTSTGITHKPYGVGWITLERNMYRLCVLQGKVRDGDKVPEDPWEMFLREFAPRAMVKRPVGERLPSAGCFPSSILREGGTASASVSGDASHEGNSQHVRFEVPVLRPEGENQNRRAVGRIPRYLN